MPRKPKHENQPAPAPNLLDAFKTPPGILESRFEPITIPTTPAVAPPPAPPAVVDEVTRRVEENLSDLASVVQNAVPETASKESLDRAAGLVPPTPPLPRAVEILFDLALALEVNEKEKTSIPVRLDAASELVAWLDSLGCARSSYDVPRTGALRVFLSSVAEYKVRCEPKERVRAAALLLKLSPA